VVIDGPSTVRGTKSSTMVLLARKKTGTAAVDALFAAGDFEEF
jgi:hypothetical protein